jgi:ribosomal protein S18 acetylase RimI-like enzyme
MTADFVGAGAMAERESTGQRDRLQVEVRKAANTDAARVVAVLARAFDDDPFVNWMAAQDKRRARRIYDAMALAYRMVANYHEVYTTEGVHGAALWAPPGKWQTNLLYQLRLLPQAAKVSGWKRMLTVGAGLNAVEQKHPEQPHYYLYVLGTDPVDQGKGVGSQLVQPVLEKCDRERMPAYLESSKEKNVPFYERHGFRVVERFQVPNGGPPLWLMWREPN